MQIYKNLDIGTAKPTREEMKNVPHHMIDIVPPTEQFSVERYCALASQKIKEVYGRGKLPIMVGGTGLYIDNTVLATTFSAPQRNEELCNELLEFAKQNGNEALFDILLRKDASAASKLHPNDTKRVIRAIETLRTTGKTRNELDKESRPLVSPYDFLYMAIDMDRSVLYGRIDRRVDMMLDCGLVEEVKKYILPVRKDMSTALTAIGYREVLWYLDGLCTYNEMCSLLKRNTRRYAKRQLTWLRKNDNIKWLDYKDALNQAQKQLKEHLTRQKGF